MDLLRLGGNNSFLSQRRRKWLILISISGFSGYGVYKIYHLPSFSRKRKRFMKIFEAILSLAELISESSQTMSLLSRDLKSFLNSDSDEIPNSLKQIAKITNSNEFIDSLARVSQALTIGVFRGYNLASLTIESESSVVDRVIDKVFSKAGSGFVSVVVGSFAKNLVLVFYSNQLEKNCDCDCDCDDSTPRWVNLLCDEKCRELLADCIHRFTSTAVAIYLDKTMEINTYDQIFAGLTNPQHQDSVKDVLVSVCNGALATIVKTSHEVFITSPKPNNPKEEIEKDENTRRFMFDVAGRVTLETTRSIMAFLMLKTLQGFNVVREEVTDRGRQVVGYVGDKSSVIVTVCLALYLHIISGCVRNSPIGISHHF